MPRPLPERDERTRQLWIAQNFHDYIASVYMRFADPTTRQLFAAVHQGLGVGVVQRRLMAAEIMSAAAPNGLIPWERRVWEPVIKVQPLGTPEPVRMLDAVDFEPYGILGVKRLVGPDVSRGQIAEARLVGGDPLPTESSWVEDWTYDRTTGIFAFGPSLAPGTYWIPEMWRENRLAWTVTAGGIGIEEYMRPGWYSAEHMPHWISLLDFALQRGFSEGPFRRAVSAAAGNPFAYAAGTVVAVEPALDMPTRHGRTGHYVIIETGPGSVHYCESPPACWLPEGAGETDHLIAIGTEVKRFQTLLSADAVTINTLGARDSALGPAHVVRRVSGRQIETGRMSRSWEEEAAAFDLVEDVWHGFEPIVDMGIGASVVSLRRWEGLDAFGLAEFGRELVWGDDEQERDRSGSDWSWEGPEALTRVGAGTPITLRNITSGITQTMTIRRISDNQILVDEYIPESNPGDLLVAQVYSGEPRAAVSFDVSVDDLSGNGRATAVEFLVKRVLPGSSVVRVRIAEDDFDGMHCLWDDQDEAWGPIPESQGIIWEKGEHEQWDWNTMVWE